MASAAAVLSLPAEGKRDIALVVLVVAVVAARARMAGRKDRHTREREQAWRARVGCGGGGEGARETPEWFGNHPVPADRLQTWRVEVSVRVRC